MSLDITPLVLTFNEGPNIGRTLEKLGWAKEIVVIDSYSTDDTLEIVKLFPQARIIQRKFDSFASQCNFGLQQVKTEWVLSLDADYILSDELNRELQEPKITSDIAGFRATFIYCIDGRHLRATLYPPRTVLYRKALANYREEGHGHRVMVQGNVSQLRHPIFHDDRKPLDHWFREQMKYATQEASYLVGSDVGDLKGVDRIRQKIIFAPALIFFYTLFAKGLVLDGWPGWYYVFQRTLAEILLSLRLTEAKLKSRVC